MKTFEEWSIKNLFDKKPLEPKFPQDTIDPYGEEIWENDFFKTLLIKKIEAPGNITHFMFQIKGDKFFPLGQYHNNKSNSFLFCLDLMQDYIGDKTWYKASMRKIGDEYIDIDNNDLQMIEKNYLEMLKIDSGCFQGKRIIDNIVKIKAILSH